MRFSFLIATALTGFSASASEQVLPPGGNPCEADWFSRSQFDSLPTLGYLNFLEKAAERGEVAVQLRLGLVQKTHDGKWSAPKDFSYNIHWLEKARAQGSKSASWEMAKIKWKVISHESYLRAAIAAAEEEGNPWAATELMNLTNGRWGSSRKTTDCLAEVRVEKKCAPEGILPISSARKWAEIAAEGGNAQAQEWLCWSAAEGNEPYGQPKDDSAAFKWCQIAAHNSCAYWSVTRLQNLYRDGRGVMKDNDAANRIGMWSNQLWRKPSGRFFFFGK